MIGILLRGGFSPKTQNQGRVNIAHHHLHYLSRGVLPLPRYPVFVCIQSPELYMAARATLQRAGICPISLVNRQARRAMSDGKGRVLSEEEQAAENVYIKKMEKEKLEKLKKKKEKEKAAEEEPQKTEPTSKGVSGD